MPLFFSTVDNWALNIGNCYAIIAAMWQRCLKIAIWFLILLFPLCLFAGHNSPLVLHGIRVSAENNKSRLVFDLKGREVFKYKAFFLDDPGRVVIDLKAVKLTADLDHPALLNTAIKSIRSSTSGKNNLRLVLDLKYPAKYKLLVLENNRHTSEKRLVLDLEKGSSLHHQQKIVDGEDLTPSHNVIAVPAVKKLPPVIGPAPAASTAPVSIVRSELVQAESLDNNDEKSEVKTTEDIAEEPQPVLKPKILPRPIGKVRDITIVIDPGHGGDDSGAVGPGGSLEKNVVLSISKYLQQYLNQEGGFRALLTRNGDYFIALRDRLHIAHYDHADLFIAVHADACDKSDRRGASVYALSQRGATSELARYLAEKENASELGQKIADTNLAVKKLVIDLAQTWTINNSLLMGEIMLHQMNEVCALHIPHVEQAAFVVLKSPDIPSLLVETGFISNPYEEVLLNKPEHQQKIAYALAKGIKQYYIEHPPPRRGV